MYHKQFIKEMGRAERCAGSNQRLAGVVLRVCGVTSSIMWSGNPSNEFLKNKYLGNGFQMCYFDDEIVMK
jgi:hypothetical protein